MFYIIELLNQSDIDQIMTYAETADFKDGAATAGVNARPKKSNLQAVEFDKSDAARLVKARMGENAKLKMAAVPAQLSPLLLSKYSEGMEYDIHTDNALMEGGRLRTDLAFTLFLSDPHSCQGGELSISTGDVERSFKLNAGSMILYPASFMHRVKRVESGSRLAVVGWIQSMVADVHQRSIIYDLSVAQAVTLAGGSKSEAHDRLSLAISNLLRLWVKS